VTRTRNIPSESLVASHEQFRRDREFVASCDHLRLLASIAVELAEQGITIFSPPVGEFPDEVFDLLTRGVTRVLEPQ